MKKIFAWILVAIISLSFIGAVVFVSTSQITVVRTFPQVYGGIFALIFDIQFRVANKEDLGRYLQHHPDAITSRNAGGELPIHFAVMSDLPEILPILAGDDRRLVNAGRTPAPGRPGAGMTPLHYAAILNKTECIRVLLSLGADPSVRCADDKLPVDHTRRLRHAEATQLLEQAMSSDEN